MDGPAGRRGVFNDVRRQLERQALLARAAEDLAAAVEAYLAGAPAGEGRDELLAALVRFRATARG